MPIQPRQTWEEFCEEQERENQREAKAILSYQKQMRGQRKPLVNVWIAIGAVILLLGAMYYVFMKIAEGVGL